MVAASEETIVAPATRKGAALLAELWLGRLSTFDSEEDAMRELGLLFCGTIASGDANAVGEALEGISIPPPAEMMLMSSQYITLFCNRVTSYHRVVETTDFQEAGHQGNFIGGLACSYANAGEILVTSALVRFGGYLCLTSLWLDYAEQFLLEQQSCDGHFGLYSRELKMIPDGRNVSKAMLQLTVDILWTISVKIGNTSTLGTRKAPG